MYLLINSLVDMVCYSFALSASIILTLSICLILVTGAIILKFQIHALKFFSLLVPSGCPLGLLPLLVLIEFISYLSRNVSLGLSLVANNSHVFRCLVWADYKIVFFNKNLIKFLY